MTFNEEDWGNLVEYREYLEHYGVKGMKWGVRNEREKTGRRTSAKKKAAIQNRLSILERRKKKRQQKAKEAEKKRQTVSAKKAEARRTNILRSPTKLYKNRYDFTQDEINSALKQFEWESKLRDYSQKELQAGKRYIDNAFQYTVATINLYNQAARVVNSFNLSEKPWTYIEDIKKSKKDDKGKKGD